MIEITAEYLASQGLSEDFPQRFWAKVRKTETCWIWSAAFYTNGYGQITSAHSHCIRAHRASWIICKGPIPTGLKVLHNCPEGDNPACVNPDHLWIGTCKDNTHDMIAKGRLAVPKATLTWDSACDARTQYAAGATIKALSKLFGVTRHTMWMCVNMKTWASHFHSVE
jgi:hypothetical protein